MVTSLLASSNLSSHLFSIHICIHGILHTWPYPTAWQSATCSLHKHIGKIWQDGKSNVGFARRLAARCTQSPRHSSWKVNSVTVNDRRDQRHMYEHFEDLEMEQCFGGSGVSLFM